MGFAVVEVRLYWYICCNNSVWLLVLCRDRRRRSRSPPRRGSGRGRGPVTPTVGEIPPQPSESHKETQLTSSTISHITEVGVSYSGDSMIGVHTCLVCITAMN